MVDASAVGVDVPSSSSSVSSANSFARFLLPFTWVFFGGPSLPYISKYRSLNSIIKLVYNRLFQICEMKLWTCLTYNFFGSRENFLLEVWTPMFLKMWHLPVLNGRLLVIYQTNRRCEGPWWFRWHHHLLLLGPERALVQTPLVQTQFRHCANFSMPPEDTAR